MACGQRKAIAEVRVGERVIATDPQTGESGARAVERVIRSEGQKTLVRVRVSGELITATDRHPFWVEGQGAYREAAELRPGDVLREPDGERAAVESVRVMAPAPERVHNLTVAGLHTYYAGQAPVLVHNAGCLTDGERIGIVREALQRKGNYGLGSASRREADELGQAFVGPGFTRSRREPGILLSRDGLRRYRPPSFKPELGRYQANLERRFEPGPRQRFNGNGHLDISDP